MVELIHRVRVFPYSMERREPNYLLRLREQGVESCWGPLQGEIGHDEQMEGAVHRQVQEGMGLAGPLELVDLNMPAHWVLGDEEIIEWSFGCRIPAELDPVPDAILRWERFVHAYPSLELETDRAAILRLHALLRAA
jgi:ADP-ribose pyrophosphatase YjhB (NUDIX family)